MNTKFRLYFCVSAFCIFHSSFLFAQTPYYYLNRSFSSVQFDLQGIPTEYLLNEETDKLTDIVQGSITTSSCYAIEKQTAVAIGYGSALSAWNAVVAYNGTTSTYSGKIFDNVGWVRGTRQQDEEWGAYLWVLQNHIEFQASTSAWWSTTSGIPVAISNVMVGSLGDYQATSNVVDIGPVIPSNFPGANDNDSHIYQVDITNVYYTLIIPDIWIMPRDAFAPLGSTNPAQYTVTGTNIPQGVTWITIPDLSGSGGATIISNGAWQAVIMPGNIATNYIVRATSVDNTNFYDEVNLAVLKVDFLDASKNEASTLKVGKWENGFNAGPVVKDNFIDLDPDRFYVRVNDQSKKGSGKVGVKLSTGSAGTDYDDDATEIELAEEPANSGVFISTNMLLVADDVDDNFTNMNVVADDTKNDRTHKIALGGKVNIQYPETGTMICEKEANVPPQQKSATINVVILRDKALADGGTPVADPGTVSNHWKVTCERYAQTGVKIEWTVSVADPPAGVDLADGIAAAASTNANKVSTEMKALIDGLGTGTNNTDFHAFYVSGLYWTNSPAFDPLYGVGIANYWFDPSEDGYLYNAIMDNTTATAGKLFNPAHEVGHCLTDAAHHSDAWNIMATPTSTSNTSTGTKRFDNTQGGIIYNDPHCN